MAQEFDPEQAVDRLGKTVVPRETWHDAGGQDSTPHISYNAIAYSGSHDPIAISQRTQASMSAALTENM